jgi:MATE family multidrug resistance protein
MIPLALGIATSSRVGFWLGANQPDRVHRTLTHGLGLSAATAVFCCASLWLGKEALVKAFTDDADVAFVAIGLLGWVALYHFFDAIQTVCAFLLRCFRITLIPLLIYSVMLWGIGLGGGYVWAYIGIASWPAMPLASSFWMASCAALGVVMVLFLGLTFRAAKRTKRSEEKPQNKS